MDDGVGVVVLDPPESDGFPVGVAPSDPAAFPFDVLVEPDRESVR